MALESQVFKIKGMQQDTTESLFSGEFAFENMNMSITSQGGNTLLSVSTEQGNTPVNLRDENEDIDFRLEGVPLGYGLINDILIIFTKGEQYDFIYKITSTDADIKGKELFKGSLNFDLAHPIETVSFYENENIQKIYWVDGLNQARLINISGNSFNNNSFDFVQTLGLNEKITITKRTDTNGMFPSGIIQYAFTYLNDYGQESNVFYTSPLYNTSLSTRGGTPEERIGNTFDIKLEKLDITCKSVRVYSIVRTSIDSTPTIRNVIDVDISSQTVVTTTSHQEIQPFISDGVDDFLLAVNTSRVVINSSSPSGPYEYFEVPSSATYIKRSGYSNKVPIYIDLVTNKIYENIAPPRLNIGQYPIVNLVAGDELYFPRGSSSSGVIEDGVTINGLPLAVNYTEPITIYYPTGPVQGENYYYKYIVTMDGTTVSYDAASNRQSLHIPTNAEPETVTIYPEYDVIPLGENIDKANEHSTANPFICTLVDFGYRDPNTAYPNDSWMTQLYVYLNTTNPPDIGIKISKVPYSSSTNPKPIFNIPAGTILMFKKGYTSPYININGVSKAEEYVDGIFRYEVKYDGTYATYDAISGVYTMYIPKGPTITGQGTIITVVDSTTTTESIEQTVIDNNTLGSTVDPTSLLYVGGEPLVPQTITQKDNTLFLGNIKLLRLPAGSKDLLRGGTITFDRKSIPLEFINYNNDSTLYSYKSNSLKFNGLHNKFESFKTLKSKEWYRFGVQFQHESGIWSEAIYINDAKNNLIPEIASLPIPTEGEDYGYSSANLVAKGIKAKYTLNSIQPFLDKGYKRVRGVIVYPTANDRAILAQGVLNPTLYNLSDRIAHVPDVISSWYFRPLKMGSSSTLVSDGEYLENRHNYSLPKYTHRNCEIQECTYDDTYPGPPAGSDSTTINNFRNYHGNQFYIDSSIVTMHSPDIEFGDEFGNISTENLKLRIIGFTPLRGFKSKVSLTYTGSTYNTSALGFVPFKIENSDLYDKDGGKVLASALMFSDKNPNNNSTELYAIFPWHSSNSLNADTSRTYAKLEHKRMSNLRYSRSNIYLPNTATNDYNNKIDAVINMNIGKVKIFNSNEITTLKLDKPNNSNLSELYYQGNVDKIISANDFKTSYYVVKSSDGTNAGTYTTASVGGTPKTDPIRIQFKSTPHAVFSLDWNSLGQQVILPGLVHNRNSTYAVTSPNTPLWASSSFGTYQKLVTIDKVDYLELSGMWLAELYRDDADVVNRFGGTSQAALESNNWMPCGEPVSLIDNDGNALDSVTVEYTEGDTYIQRYDCLKTYGDINNEQSMVEILSFLCETRINLDARTDNNRGLEDNRLMSPSNFNIINPVYNQKNSYFPVNVIDYDKFTLDNFPNTVTWTKSKIAGDIVDTWTNITLASVLDLDGVYGPITSLNNFGNEVIAFQNTAISNILFNSRVQVNASDGVPIEIANNYKVDGKRYISTKVGTTNKWSIKDSLYGLYFIDNLSKGIYLYNGKLDNLTDKLGFHSWAINNLSNQAPYSIFNDNFTTHVDNINDKIYFINNETCLVYSEQLQQFTSFMNYEGTHFMMNAFNKFLSLRQAFNVSYEDRNYFNIWEQGVGQYNKYFGVIKPSWITILANDKAQKEKIFNTLDVRADAFNNNILTAEVPFNTLTAWNEYQNGSISLTQGWNKASSFKQKFRIWRANIPGSSIVNSNLRPSNSNRFSIRQDRMRNPWLYIKLESNGLNGYQTVLQDITVNYSI